MDRRTAIKRTTLIMGAALASGTVAGLMQGCKAEKQLDWQPNWLSGEEANTISALTDTILPKTSTPSASEVGVPEFIDDVIGHFWNQEDQQSFRDGISAINDRARDQYGSQYADLSEEEQNTLMDELVEAARNHSGEGRPFFRQLKELTYSGYFSSEIIGEQVLAYDPVPGEYIGDLPVSEVDNAWSL